MPWWVIAILVFGGNFTLWGIVGLLRLTERLIVRLPQPRRTAAAASGAAPGRRRRDGRPLPEAGVTQLPGAAAALPGTGAAGPEAEAVRPGAGEASGRPQLGARPERTAPGKAVPAGERARSVLSMAPAPADDELTAPLPALRPESAQPVGAGRTSADLSLPLPALPVSVADSIRDADGGGLGRRAGREIALRRSLTVDDVAVLIPAHNEALVIEDSIRAVLQLVPPSNVHVVSDGSTDDTYEIAARSGVHVIKTHRNVGKAGALQEAIRRFMIVQRFPVVMLLDADTRVEPGYFDAALPMFDDPRIVAVAGCVKTARDRKLTGTGNVLVGHRQRIYSIGQRVLKFGQTWLHVNATHIVPGFASIYRTDVLPRIEMNPPGLVIEDFNMTFEVYQRRLGKVGFSLSAVAVTQDPDNFRDYVKQTRRWAVGMWQTVRRHPPRPNLFSAMLALLLLELITASLLFLMLPLILLILGLPYLDAGTLSLPVFGTVHAVVAAHMNLRTVLLGVGVPDYAMTIMAAACERQPRLLLYGVAFPVLRVVDAAIGLWAIPLAWLSRSTGQWRSPARRKAQVAEMPGTREAADGAGEADSAPASATVGR